MRVSHRKRSKYFPYLLLSPTILALLLITIFPLIYGLNLSVRHVILYQLEEGQPFIGLDNFISMLNDPMFFNALNLTSVLVVATVSLELLIGLALALLLNKEFRGAGVVTTALLMPMMMAPIVVGLMWKFMYNYDFGIFQYLLDLIGIPKMLFLGSGSLALPSIIVADIWQWTPFMMLVILAGLRSLPRAPFEAAMIDGASGPRVFADITLPLLKPIILIAVLLRAIDSFKMFDQIFIMTRGGPGIATEVFSMHIYLRAFAYYYVGYATAMALTMLYAVSVIAAPLIKNIESSFESKGT